MKKLKKIKSQKSSLDFGGIKFGRGGCVWNCEAYCHYVCGDRWDYYASWDQAMAFVNGDLEV